MINNNGQSYKRYAHSLLEIESDIKQIKENYEIINEECKVEMDVNPDPREVHFDGDEKEFNVSIKTIYC